MTLSVDHSGLYSYYTPYCATNFILSPQQVGSPASDPKCLTDPLDTETKFLDDHVPPDRRGFTVVFATLIHFMRIVSFEARHVFLVRKVENEKCERDCMYRPMFHYHPSWTLGQVAWGDSPDGLYSGSSL